MSLARLADTWRASEPRETRVARAVLHVWLRYNWFRALLHECVKHDNRQNALGRAAISIWFRNTLVRRLAQGNHAMVKVRRIALHQTCTQCGHVDGTFPDGKEFARIFSDFGASAFRPLAIETLHLTLLQRAGTAYCSCHIDRGLCNECATRAPKRACLLCRKSEYERRMLCVGKTDAARLLRQCKRFLPPGAPPTNHVCVECVSFCPRCFAYMFLSSSSEHTRRCDECATSDRAAGFRQRNAEELRIQKTLDKKKKKKK